MITAPTQHAQAELMRAACARAGLSPQDVDYIEAHATGTRVGDRIEGNAIREVFGGESRPVPLRVASVKSNVGHMEAAAFTCALLKVLLMFEHRTYAPVSSHFVVPNPDIDFTGLRVQTEGEPFGGDPVTIGINSFGFGGANGHCLLTEYRPVRAPAYSRPVAPDAAYLVPLSARTPEALLQSAVALRDVLAEEPDFDLYTLAGNLSRRRTHFAARTAFAATGLPELAARLEAFAQDPTPVSTVAEAKTESRVLMVFAGQGTQWAGCGRARRGHPRDRLRERPGQHGDLRPRGGRGTGGDAARAAGPAAPPAPRQRGLPLPRHGRHRGRAAYLARLPRRPPAAGRGPVRVQRDGRGHREPGRGVLVVERAPPGAVHGRGPRRGP